MKAADYLKLWQTKVTDPHLLQEIKTLTNLQDIENRFSGYLQFGTAGLRGILGAGTRYINKYTISKATLGIVEYLKQTAKNATVVIAYDNRKNSYAFAKLCAQLFSHSGIKCYLFEQLTPTPVLSFAVRQLNATLGINITSSHNPKEYSGYKVVNSLGCQISTTQADAIIQHIKKIDEFSVDYAALENITTNITPLTNQITDDFITASLAQLNHTGGKNNLQIIYTPLHGTGYYGITKILKELGFTVTVPASQSQPDENFPTCKLPNPELLESFNESLALPESSTADIIIASDPDADRLGIMVKHNNAFVKLTGDELGLIFLHYLIEQRKATGTLSKDDFMVTTVVSSPLAQTICKANNVRCFHELTGFKNIGNRIIEEFKTHTEDNFLLAYEESFGYLVSTHLCDKDAITPAALIAIIADSLKGKNQTLVDYLAQIGQTYGHIVNHNTSTTYKGVQGIQQITQVVNTLRTQTITNIGDFIVESQTDYLTDNTGLEPSNFLQYNLNYGCRVTIRPSGTEPKLKIYYSSYHADHSTCVSNLNQLITSVNKLLKTLV